MVVVEAPESRNADEGLGFGGDLLSFPLGLQSHSCRCKLIIRWEGAEPSHWGMRLTAGRC